MTNCALLASLSSFSIGFLAALALGPGKLEPVSRGSMPHLLTRALQHASQLAGGDADREEQREGTRASDPNRVREATDLHRSWEAYSASIDLVNRAIAGGRWTADDARHLRVQLERMNREHEEEILRALVASVNRGSVAVEEPGALF